MKFARRKSIATVAAIIGVAVVLAGCSKTATSAPVPSVSATPSLNDAVVSEKAQKVLDQARKNHQTAIDTAIKKQEDDSNQLVNDLLDKHPIKSPTAYGLQFKPVQQMHDIVPFVGTRVNGSCSLLSGTQVFELARHGKDTLVIVTGKSKQADVQDLFALKTLTICWDGDKLFVPTSLLMDPKTAHKEQLAAKFDR